MSAIKRIIAYAIVVWLSVSFSRIGFALAKVNEAQTARVLALNNLITSIEGTPKEPVRIFKTKDGYLRFIGVAPSMYFAVATGTPEKVADEFIGKWCNLFVNESSAVEFQKILVKTQKERSYVRYQQLYSGLEVFGAEMIVQVNVAGGIEAVISDIMRDTQVLDTGVVSLKPSIDTLTAQKKGMEFLSEQHQKLKFVASEPVLMIYAPEVVGNSGEPQLVWKTEVGNIGEPLVKELMLVDAHNGEVSLHYSLICSAMYREIWDYEGTYYAVLKRTEGQDPCGIPDVDQAYDYLGDTYHFYDVNHSRDSYDGNGAPLIARVRDPSVSDASWWGSYMSIAPGWATDDIVGHEFTHGVTEWTSKLAINQGEAGAINESFSDMWGEWIDQTNGDGNDLPDVKWYIGEDTPIDSFRCMKNPPEFNCSNHYYPEICEQPHPDYYKRPGYWYEGSHSYHYVHHNCGVGNKLSYLLTDGDMFRGYIVTGLGIEKTADLFYECQTNWHIPGQNYYDLGCVLTQAASNIGLTPEERENVNEACRAVGILSSGDVIYVDKDANGFNNGTSWDDAYTDLQEAFIAAHCPEVNAIWVAAGTYKPVKDINVTDYQNKTFELPEGVSLIGHFGGVGTYETSPTQRNLADANNETILDGQIGDNGYDAVNYIVKANSIDNITVDGFTIRGSYSGAGVSLNDANVTIINCKLKENYYYGIYITNNSHPYINNCFFIDNSVDGINCYDSGPVITNSTFDGNNLTLSAICSDWSDVELANCTVKNHTNYGICADYTDIKVEDCCIKDNASGIYCGSSALTVNDCVISGNCGYNYGHGIYCVNSSLITNHSVIERNSYIGLCCLSYSTLNLTNSVIRFNGNCGIYLQGVSSATIKNNWIHNNGTIQSTYGVGICFDNQSSVPLVRNNTIYDNFTYGVESSEYSADPNISNCIIYGNGIEDLSWAGTVNYCCLQSTHSGTGNIYGDPCFMNTTNPNDLHIDVNSICKNAGDPYANYNGETDIDGEGRVKYGRVDIGADEYYLSPADFNDDLIVNFIDYTLFANVWQSNNPDFSLDDDNDVDYNDLAFFCEDWLWQAGWTKEFTCGDGEGMSQIMAAGFTPAEVSYPSISPEQQIEKAEPLKIEELIDWLEQLLLDPEAQKQIDQDIWQKFIDSLKEDI